MGLFNKLKNMVSGGSAQVSLECGELKLNTDNLLTVKIINGEDVLKAKAVYLEIRCEHNGNNYSITHSDTDKDGVKETVSISKSTYANLVHKEKIELSGDTVLEPGKMFDLKHSLNLKNEFPISFNERVIWKAMAGISTFGNDPDSGWINLNVVKNSLKIFDKKWSTTTHSLLFNKGYSISLSGYFSFALLTNSDLTVNSKKYGFINSSEDSLKPILELIISQIILNDLTELLKKNNDNNFNLSSTTFFNSVQKIISADEIDQFCKIVDFNIDAIEIKALPL